MKNNPYATMLNVMREAGSVDNPPSVQLGTVLSVDPLLIKVGDLQLTKNNLLINYNLLKHDRDFSIKAPATGNVNGYHGNGALTNINVSKQKIEFETTLKANDLLVVIPTQDMQTYIILAKVV